MNLQPGYPKTMSHPAYMPAVLSSSVAGGHQGSPVRFPPITVGSSDQEEEARSRGYRAAGEAPPSVAGYAEYPKMMMHPDHQDLVPDQLVPRKHDNGAIVYDVIKGSPETHPHVRVTSFEEEDGWRKKGYTTPIPSDPHAFKKSFAHPYDPDAKIQLYPMVGPDGTIIQDPALADIDPDEYPKWVGDVIVNSREEELAIRPLTAEEEEADAEAELEELLAQEAALKSRMDALMARVKPVPVMGPEDTSSEDDRAALIAEADAKGVKIDKRWTLDKIKAAIAA